MRQRFADFFVERLVTSFKFRKMRLNGHVASLLVSDWLPDTESVHQLGWNFDARLGCATQQSPMELRKYLATPYRLEPAGTNRDNFPGCAPLSVASRSAQPWH